MASAKIEAPTPPVTLTLTAEEARALQTLLQTEKWPAGEDAEGTLSDIWAALDEAGVVSD